MDGQTALLRLTQVSQRIQEEVLIAAGDLRVGLVVHQRRGGYPHNVAGDAVVHGIADGDRQSEGAVHVPLLLLVGGQVIPRRLGKGGRGRGQQFGNGQRVPQVIRHRQTLRNGQQHPVAAVGQGRGDGVGRNVRQQEIGRAPDIMALVALHHDAVHCADTVIGHQCFQIGKLPAFRRVGDEKQIAAVAQIFPQLALLV